MAHKDTHEVSYNCSINIIHDAALRILKNRHEAESLEPNNLISAAV